MAKKAVLENKYDSYSGMSWVINGPGLLFLCYGVGGTPGGVVKNTSTAQPFFWALSGHHVACESW